MACSRVLVVEDDPYWQQLLIETLEERYQVVVAATYKEAKHALDDAQAQNRPFHVVTVDMGLPGPSQGQPVTDGHRIVDYINRTQEKTLCVVITGLPDISTTDVRNFFKRYHVYDFIDKSRFDLQEFAQTITKAVAQSEQSSSTQEAEARRCIGRYEILGEVGRGAMSIVYRARDPNIERTVALKVLRIELSSDPMFKSRFRQEARSIGRLAHPNIVTIYDADKHGDTAFIVMELLVGSTLEKVLSDEAPLAVERALDIGLQICSALEYAHQQGIVHRDIKPSNIILVQDQGQEQVKITDFGIAKMASAPRRTHSGLMGTADYMSPEQAKNEPVDHRADLYSLGVVLYEMLTGQVPFAADSPVGVIMQHILNPWPIPSDIPPSLATVLWRVSAKDPESRYQNASEMAAALRAILHEI